MIRREKVIESAVFRDWVKEERAEAKGKQEVICQFLHDRYGDVSRDLQARVKRIGDVDTLDKILKKIFRADPLKDGTDVAEGATK